MRVTIIGVTILILALAALSNAQIEATSHSPSPKLVANLARSVYKVGEAVEVTVSLENSGKESFYVPKGLGGGYDDLGFGLYLLRDGQPFCEVQANIGCVGAKTKPRSVEQLLSDNFLLLPSGGFIGLHAFLRTSCPVPAFPTLPPGKYEVGADYSGEGGCVPDLSKKSTKFPVLRSRLKAPRMQFEAVK